MSNQSTKNNDMNDDGMLNAETQRKLPQGEILQPKLRFKGFTDPWQQRKLGEVTSSLSAGRSVNALDAYPGEEEVGVLKTSSVSDDSFNPHESKTVVKDERGLVQCPVEAGTIIVSRMNTPERVGSCGLVVKAQSNLYLPDRLWKLKLKSGTDSRFLHVLLTSNIYKSRIVRMATGTSGSMHNIPKDSFLDMRIVLPDIAEQTRIGEFFRALDDLIAAAKKKADLLKLKKRYYLQAIFGQRLRFKGFTEPWQQRKLGELLSVRKETTTTPTLYHIDIELENLQEDGGLVGDATVRTNSTSVFRRGDVLFGRLRPYLRKWWLATESGIRSGEIWAIYSPSRVLISSFVYALVQSPIFLQVALITSGTKMPRSDWENIASEAGSLPCSNDEQARIGDFFNKLDNLIAASCRKIELLERCKDAYLQLLFI